MKKPGVRAGQEDLLTELRRLLDGADPALGVEAVGLGDNDITIVLAGGRIYKIYVKAAPPKVRDCGTK